MNRTTINTITEWALGQGAPGDIERMADGLRELLLATDGGSRRPSPPAEGALPMPNLGAGVSLEHLHDAVCLLLRRYLSPATEGDPELLSSLLSLAAELHIQGIREVVAGLLIGGSYRGIEGPEGPLDQQMIRSLRAASLDDAGMEMLRGLVQDLADEPAAEEHPAVSTEERADGEPDLLTGDLVPQVNDPDQVFAFVDALKEGIADRRAYARFARISVRQADFIARAAASLGLVSILPRGFYELTDRADKIPAVEDPGGREIRHRIVGEHPLVKSLGLHGSDSLPDLPRLEEHLATRTTLGAGTIRRRAQALRRWVEWWASGGR